jgi:oligoendopeptidase F
MNVVNTTAKLKAGQSSRVIPRAGGSVASSPTVFALGVEAAVMAESPARDDVSETYRWTLDALYASDDAWETAFDAFDADVEALDFDASAVADAASLREALATRDDLRERGSRLKVYATCRAWTDVDDDAAQARVRRIEDATARRDAAFDALEAAIRDAGRERVDALLEGESVLDVYEPYVDEVFRRGRYRLDPDAEAAVGELADAVDAPSRLLGTIRDRVYDSPTVQTPDGERVELTAKAWWTASAHPDRAYRQRAYDAARDAHREQRVVTAQAYADHLRSHAARARLRGYDDQLDRALDGHFPQATREGLLDAVVDHRDAFDGHLETLAARIDGDLRPWDLRAPITDKEGEADGAAEGESSVAVPYADAREIVVDAVAPLGADYQERVAAFLESDRVDVQPHDGKRGIGGAQFGADGTPGYLFLNYLGDLPSLFLFAHELAHAMHYELARDAQPAPYQRLSWTAGELPSNLHEALLARHLLESDRIPDAAVREVALRRLSPLPKARDVAFARDAIAQATGDDPLTADALDAAYREHSNALFAPVSFRDGDGWAWQRNHLDREPLVQALYLLGRTGALATARHLHAGDLSPEDYLAFLRAGDSRPPDALLGDALGLDLAGGVVESAAAEHAALAGE